MDGVYSALVDAHAKDEAGGNVHGGGDGESEEDILGAGIHYVDLNVNQAFDVTESEAATGGKGGGEEPVFEEMRPPDQEGVNAAGLNELLDDGCADEGYEDARLRLLDYGGDDTKDPT